MYFKQFPRFIYDFKYGKNTKTSVVTDITRNVRFRKEILENISLYDEYDIVDGETPEIIAEKLYGNPEYHWIIMLANQRYHYIDDFPLDNASLVANAALKYNPKLYSTAGDWYFTGTGADRKLYFKIANPQEAFNPAYLTASVSFTVTGKTTDGAFSVTKVWGTSDSGIDYNTQYFWVKTTAGSTGTITGDLTITTAGRENNPVYWENAAGYKVSPEQTGALSITGVQEEERLNEAKRRIKIISPTVISSILKQYKESL